MLWTEFSTCQSTNLKKRWLDLFCNYYQIQYVCNHSTALVVIFCCCNLSFCHIWHIQNFIVNLDTMPLMWSWKPLKDDQLKKKKRSTAPAHGNSIILCSIIVDVFAFDIFMFVHDNKLFTAIISYCTSGLWGRNWG
jgi:hypothetical protein